MTPRPRAPVVPGWEILGYIGAGGMGSVWKARRKDGAIAALKVAKPVKGLEPGESGSLFRREALACLNLDHPNLVRGLDAGTTSDGCAYLALEFVEGPTLHAVIEKDGALPEVRVLAIGSALAKALDHAHRLGIVHQDVKPKNVVLAPDGGVKLLDLGLVTETHEEGERHKLGTHGFTAPEVMKGVKPTVRSDLFSLGATLAAAATGETPGRQMSFADRTLPETSDGFTLSAGLRWVIERLLKSEPSQRYGSAAELVLDLDSLTAGERPLGAILGASGARVVRSGPRVGLITVIVAAAVCGVLWMASRRPDEPRDVPHDVPEPLPSDPKLEAAKLFVERFPEDFAQGRRLIAEADTPSLTPEQKSDLTDIARSLDLRFETAAEKKLQELTIAAAQAARDGDEVRAHDVLAAWPEAFREAPQARIAAQRALGYIETARAKSAALAAEVAAAFTALDADAAKALPDASKTLERLESALAGHPADEQSLVLLRIRLAQRIQSESIRIAASGAADEQLSSWRAAVAALVELPSPDRLRAALDAAPQSLRGDADAVRSASERAERALKNAFARVQDKRWCGPRGDAFFVGVVDERPSSEEVFLSRLWSASGGRDAALARSAGGREEAAAWLLARGRWDEAAQMSGRSGPVTRILDEGRFPKSPAVTSQADEVSVRAPLALRDPSKPPGAYTGDDPLMKAWALAIAGGPRPAPSKDPAAAEAKTRGRDAFLADDLATAWTALTDAEALAPWDAEIAALRGRTALVGSRPFPTAPTLLRAFAEGRRAWDLDPKLPAGPVLAAEAGMELIPLADADLAQKLAPIVAAACGAADALNRADGRMLAFAGAHHLAEGRNAPALALLRRASAKSPESADVAFDLARAEHAAGHGDKAKEALRRAKELWRGAWPEAAEELAKTLGE